MGIGSVLPWPEAGIGESLWARWIAGYAQVAAFGSARAALAALLRARRVRRIWLPAYLCPAVLQACAGLDVLWYGVDSRLAPQLPARVRDGDAVLGVDYFGRVEASWAARARAQPGVLWIEDRAQAVDAGPGWGHVLLYSPRKLVGVGEGGLLVSNDDLPCPGPRAVRSAAAQRARALDPAGERPETWFGLFQAQEAAFGLGDGAMGADTVAALQAVAAAPVVAARRANVARLSRALAEHALWPGAVFAGMGLPLRLRERDRVAARLAEAGVWCARHWAALPSDKAAHPLAHRLAGEMLTLPCDQRYGAAEMVAVAEAVLAAVR